MDLIVLILIGVGVGVMVELLLPGHTPSELLLAIFLGIAGALLASFVGAWADFYEKGDPESFIAALLGAFLVLLLYGVFFRKLRRHR